MALKQFNPITPGTRQLVIVDRSALHKGKPVKKLTQGLTKSGGRNNTGRTTARRMGGGHKRRSEEHTSELQSLMRSSYAVFRLKETITLMLIKKIKIVSM